MASSSPLTSPTELEARNNLASLQEDNDYLSSPILKSEDDEYEEEIITKSKSKKSNKSKSSKSKKSKKAKSKKQKSITPEESEQEEVIQRTSNRLRNKPKVVEPLSSEEDFDDYEAAPIIDKTQLTRRQKAKYLDEYSEELLELKPENKKKQYTVEEMELRKFELARKRKHQSQQKAERDKLETINKLLKKQANKKVKADNKNSQSGSEDIVKKATMISFKIDKHGNYSLSFPEEQSNLITSSKPIQQIEKSICQVQNCNLPKKYCDPKTNKISCSFEHYKLLKIL